MVKHSGRLHKVGLGSPAYILSLAFLKMLSGGPAISICCVVVMSNDDLQISYEGQYR